MGRGGGVWPARGLHHGLLVDCYSLVSMSAAEETLEGIASEAPRRIEYRRLGAGQKVDRFVVLEPRGRGGMGVVYAAYDPELDRKVALKLLHAGPRPAGSGGLLHEAQALAKLTHPNVVTVHDVGEHDGRVFVAMEYVDGQTLSTWRSSQERTLTEILEVFVQAGRGLAAAHAAALVHRDFKPDNVMVGRDGRVRVMDFGLALAPPNASSDRNTDKPRPQGTPSYMAPEQFSGHPDERSDQFSFCVAMYEAFYGERPYGGQTAAEIVFSINSGLPPERGGVPAWLAAAVRRGLSADASLRWPTMDALLAELTHDRNRRQRRVKAAVAAVALGGLGALAASWLTRTTPCEGARDQLTAIWDDTQRHKVRAALLATERAYATDTWERLRQHLDAYGDRWVNSHTDACLATNVRAEQSEALLDARMRCLHDRRTALDALVGTLVEVDLESIENAVPAAMNLPPIERCDDPRYVQSVVPPPDDPATTEQVDALRRRLFEADALAQAGRYERALAIDEEVVEAAAGIDYEPLHAQARRARGDVRLQLGRVSEAEADLREAFFVGRRSGLDELAAEAATQLVTVVGLSHSRRDEGFEWYAHAEAEVARIDRPPLTAWLATQRSKLHFQRGEFDEALAQLETARSLFARHDPDNPRLLAVLNGIGAVNLQRDHYDAAEQHFRDALQRQEAALGPMHPHLTPILNNLGNVLQAQGRNADSKAAYERAMTISEAAFGPEHPRIGDLSFNMGVLYAEQGQFEAARDAYEHAKAIRIATVGPRDGTVGQVLLNLGSLHYHQQDFAGAQAHLEQALPILEASFGALHPDVATALGNLANIHFNAKRYDEAIASQRKALEKLEQLHPGAHFDVARALANLGSMLHAQGDFEQALQLHQRGLAQYEQLLGKDSPGLVRNLQEVGLAHLELGDIESARRVWARGLALPEGSDFDQVHAAITRFRLGELHWDQGNHEEARAMVRQAAVVLNGPPSLWIDEDVRTELVAWLAEHDGGGTK